MAYKIMNNLIENYKKGRRTYSKERLSEMLDVYYGAGKLKDDEYNELSKEIESLED